MSPDLFFPKWPCLGTFHSSGCGCKTIWNSAGLLWVLPVWSFRKDWSVDGARTAAIAEAREAVEGCVPVASSHSNPTLSSSVAPLPRSEAEEH